MKHLRTSLLLMAFISSGFIFTADIQSQDTSIIKYLPLQVGNVWVYNYSYGTYLGQCHAYIKYTISGVSQINNKFYFQFERVRRVIDSTGSCYDITSRLFIGNLPLRIDSMNLNIYKSNCNTNPEAVIDSLNSRICDTATVCGSWQGNRAVYRDSMSYYIFGDTIKTKNFEVRGFEGYNSQRYLKNIGLVEYNYSQHGEGAHYFLKGCIINNILYGDTSLTGINKISSEIPESFSLSQNYPNPFNPTTKIKFSIPMDSRLLGNDNVVLKVYDALGREVQTLVNEQLQAGTYEVDFDGNNYSSGIYYYTLQTETYNETKRMVLIK